MQGRALGHQAAIARRGVCLKSQNDHIMISAGRDQFGQAVLADKRRIAEQHHRIAREIRQSGAGLRHGMTCAQLFILANAGHRVVGQGRLNLIRAMTCDHHNPRGLEAEAAGKAVFNHRNAAQRMQHLGQVGIHPRPLACGQNDQGNGACAHEGAFWDLCLFGVLLTFFT